MRIISRSVTTTHSKEEVFHIMKQAAYRYRSTEFTDNRFRIAFPANWGRKVGAIQVRGVVEQRDGGTQVQLAILGGLAFYIAMLALLAGVLVFLCSLFVGRFAISFLLLGIVLGAAAYIVALFDGITCLDSLEHRLTRRTEE